MGHLCNVTVSSSRGTSSCGGKDGLLDSSSAIGSKFVELEENYQYIDTFQYISEIVVRLPSLNLLS
jgi:hypothetical protein